MSLDFKDDFFNDETFYGDFTFRNSPRAIRRFPFPFDRDDYMYSVNMEPHVPGRPGSVFEHTFDVDEHYVSEMRDRERVLKQDPLRCQSLPHMTLAGWDLLELIMESFARDYPQWFSLTKNGNHWHWINRPLNIDQKFTFLDESTLPYGPMEYITRQAQGDFTLQDQRDGTLWVEAGMVTTQADWSLDFDIGMSFHEWHAPVPMAHETGVFDRALKFLLNLKHGAPVRRFNWTMTVDPLLDTSPENYHKWGHTKATLTPENIGRRQHLRVELQTLFRLPRSNAIAFPIRCYLCAFQDIVTQPKWGRRLHRVVRDLPDALATYKGFIRNRPLMVEYLSQFDDGAPTSPGWWPED
ncbi:heme-dependent oxidative N-demethylase family protein [Gemmobacter denitrificans]|uniref:Heme-dependent oxidative N-demethylase subunit alpha family protein n=1 Tax=Gemmobacter denitrificans TaxID=3123040 RepID=A0ABU8BWS7_9RHOB